MPNSGISLGELLKNTAGCAAANPFEIPEAVAALPAAPLPPQHQDVPINMEILDPVLPAFPNLKELVREGKIQQGEGDAIPDHLVKDILKTPPTFITYEAESELALEELEKMRGQVNSVFFRPNQWQLKSGAHNWGLWFATVGGVIADAGTLGQFGLIKAMRDSDNPETLRGGLAAPTGTKADGEPGICLGRVGPAEWKALREYTQKNSERGDVNWGYCNVQAAYFCALMMERIAKDPQFKGFQVRQVYAVQGNHSWAEVKDRAGLVFQVDPWLGTQVTGPTRQLDLEERASQTPWYPPR